MAFKVTVWTEGNDDYEYELDKTFKTRQAAHKELDDIIENGAYLDDYQIVSGKVDRTDD